MIPDEAKSRLSKFKDRPWRQYQKETVEFAMGSKKKFKIIEAPTGSGKSICGMVCGTMAGEANYLCSTKILQTQIIQDFPEAKSLWGRNNYPCLLNDTKTCDQCSATKANPCELAGKCIYPLTKKIVLASPLRILNYSYYLTEVQFAGRFSDSPLVIIDEADSLENTLVNHISLTFTERSLFRLGLESGPSKKTVSSKDGISSWKEFGKEALSRSTEIYKKLTQEIDTFERIEEDWQFQKVRERDYFVHLSERCEMFINNVDSTWLMEITERQGSKQAQTIFRPLWITPDLAEEFLWQHADSFILMSASFLPLPVLCKTLGMDIDDVDYKAVPSTFPIENRPINIWPVANVVTKNMDEAIPKIVKGIKKILNMHLGERGLIHGVSYSLCKKIIDEVKSPRLKIHNSQDKQTVLDDFIKNDDDSVLVSPSMERGVSLDGSKCTFVICVKAPYLSLTDKITSQRLYSSKIGKLWYRAAMMLSIVQSCGRGVRNDKDRCVCYLIDSQIEKVYTENPSLFPRWFSDAIGWDENPLVD